MRYEVTLFGFLVTILGCSSALAAPAPGETFQDCEDCPEMVVIPSGNVMIGSYETEAYRRKGERGKQKAKIKKPFAMGKTEVTLRQYRQFVTETGHEGAAMVFRGQTYEGCNYFDGKGYGFVKNHNWDNPGFPQREEEPVLCVSWSDATAFAEWVSEKTGRTYRVPSTVEFEYAMRAGTETPWVWGTDPASACEYANIADETLALKHPKRASFNCSDGYLYATSVGKFKPNTFGLYDMLGNAWEWTNDCWHDDLKKAPTDGSSWQEEDGGDCTARTPKGGGWISGPAWSRASVRSKDGEHYRSFMLGFRLAADIE